MNFSSIDLFCHVIDNLGDAGVAFRFATELKLVSPECRVRLFLDNIDVLGVITSPIDTGLFIQKHEEIVVIDSRRLDSESVERLGCADVLVELFGCHSPECYYEKALVAGPLIINLEYLSAEKWVEGYHLKESLLPGGSAKKFFFMPGFTPETGGLLYNSKLQRQKKELAFRRKEFILGLLRRYRPDISIDESALVGTVFTYERGFDTLVSDLGILNREAVLLCFGEKTHSGMRQSLARCGDVSYRESSAGKVHFVFMPLIEQQEYDTLLCCADFNMVRGEDSLVQAVMAGKPFIWNAYLQEEKYQKVKVEAFLEIFRPFFDSESLFATYRDLELRFNDAPTETNHQVTSERYLPFFENLKKIEHATSEMSYFMMNNRNLVVNFRDFIREFK